MHMTLGLTGNDLPSQLTDYVANGAKEFFVGYVPPSWTSHYGWEVSPGRRAFGPLYNYTKASQITDIIHAAHDLGATVDMAVNAHDNGRERMNEIHEIFDTLEPLNPDSYIVADPAVMYCMKEWGIRRPIHLSTGVGCFNSESIRFFCSQFPVERVVIPRKMTLSEMAEMIGALKDLNLEYEVMIMAYRCLLNDEDCHSVHSAQCSNLCSEVAFSKISVSTRFPDDWKQTMARLLAKEPDEQSKEEVLDEFVRRWKSGPSYSFKGFFPAAPRDTSGISGELAQIMYGNCGLCAIKALRQMGVKVLKMPLRGENTYKLAQLKLVNQVMTCEDPTPEFCRKLIGSPEYCNSKNNCYYWVPESQEEN